MDSAAALPFSTITLRPTSTAQIQWKELTSKEGTWFARVGGYENILEHHHVIGKAYLKFMSQPHGGGERYKNTRCFNFSWKEEISPGLVTWKLFGTEPNGRQHEAQARDPTAIWGPKMMWNLAGWSTRCSDSGSEERSEPNYVRDDSDEWSPSSISNTSFSPRLTDGDMQRGEVPSWENLPTLFTCITSYHLYRLLFPHFNHRDSSWGKACRLWWIIETYLKWRSELSKTSPNLLQHQANFQ